MYEGYQSYCTVCREGKELLLCSNAVPRLPAAPRRREVTCVFAAVGKGIYVYNLQMKRVIACQRTAHDSIVLHIAKLPNRQLISCSEDGSVRIWELREKQQLPAEPVPTGFLSSLYLSPQKISETGIGNLDMQVPGSNSNPGGCNK
ncbi:WD repeat-containing protein 41 [Chelonia mydas]|uniref:WD repeat-containing protein 41 n=1 Tax=Chelonia mydas TaxID=8469 RepID=M7AV04_CHEMY|nr:WD repeat-containing protein 41 [Chelonia mydas]